MPAGVSASKYITFLAAAMLSMMAGSQFVHVLYQPLEGLDILVEKEKERLKASMSIEKVQSDGDKS